MSKEDKAARIEFAKSYIIANPSKGKDKINAAIKTEFGVGLRRIDVARLKEKTLLGRTKRSTGIKSQERLIKEQIITPSRIAEEQQRRIITIGFDAAQHMLRSAGFLQFEINTIFSAQGVTQAFNSKPFKAMLKYRREFLQRKRKLGWTKAQIITNIKQHYQVKDARGKPLTDPFDFLRHAYIPQPKKDKAVIKAALDRDYEINKQKRAAGKVAGLYDRNNMSPKRVR